MDCFVYYREGNKQNLPIKRMVAFFFKKIKKSGQVSVHLVSIPEIKKLNKKFRGLDKVTDVLSFSMREGDQIPAVNEEDWGDIFICPQQIKKQAKENKVSFRNELARMIIHGLLHLDGHDHHEPQAARKMFNLQEKLVSDFLSTKD